MVLWRALAYFIPGWNYLSFLNSTSLCLSQRSGLFLDPVFPVEDFVRQIMNSLGKSYQSLSREHRGERGRHHSSQPLKAKPFHRIQPAPNISPCCWLTQLLQGCLEGTDSISGIFSLFFFALFSISAKFQLLPIFGIPDNSWSTDGTLPELPMAVRVLFFQNTDHEHF